MDHFRIVAVLLIALAAGISVSAQKHPVSVDPLKGFERDIEQGKLAETERPLLDFALADPQNVRAVELVGRLRVAQGRIDEAKALYARVLSLDPRFYAASVRYAEILVKAGFPEDARRVLATVDTAGIADPVRKFEYARALALVGDFRRAAEIAEALPASLRNSDALPTIALCYIELGDRTKVELAVAAAKKAAIAKPVAILPFAEVLLEKRMLPAVIELLRPVATAVPKNFEVFVMLAKAEVLTRDLAAAKIDLDRASALRPDTAETLFLRAAIANSANDATAAFALLEKAAALEPNSTLILSQFVVTAMRANKTREAVKAAQHLLTLEPDDPDALYLLGASSLQAGGLEAAQRSLERLMQLRPNDSRGCLALGLTLATRPDQIEPARRQLERCLEIDPRNFEAKYQLGLSYKAQGDVPKAIQILEETIAMAPNYAIALRDLGTVYLQAGKEPEAKTVLERSISINPNDADTNFQLSRLYNLTGQPELAKKYLEMFQKLRNPKGGNGM